MFRNRGVDRVTALEREVRDLTLAADSHIRLLHKGKLFPSCPKCQAQQAEIRAKETALKALRALR